MRETKLQKAVRLYKYDYGLITSGTIGVGTAWVNGILDDMAANQRVIEKHIKREDRKKEKARGKR